jgi:hydrogenase expression/formation protein HypD
VQGEPSGATAQSAFRDPSLVRKLLGSIERLALRMGASAERPVRIMEVCGTHTVAIARAGFRSVLPAGIRLLSGPGCPVCVTANADIDAIIACTRVPGVTVATFGDMTRVPGSTTSLAERKAEGAAVQVVYSPLDAIKLARQEPERDVVFVGVGFETTTPLVAATIKRARQLGLENFCVIGAHKRVPPAIAALASDPDVKLDAMLLPGHVSTVIGSKPYGFLASDYNIPGVITGFEPVDILLGIEQILEQMSEGRAAVEIAYKRGVAEGGNPAARASIDEVFEVTDASWRGLGSIAGSGYAIREEFQHFDAKKRLVLEVEPTREHKGCRCGEVLRGVMAPPECPLFSNACNPAHPIGPCMVSSEGSCAAYHRYQAGASLT